MTQSVIVVGAGLVGAACALALSRRGATVTLVDPAPGRGAVWASGGMLGPIYEAVADPDVAPALAAALLEARALWTPFAARKGVRIGQGTLVLLDPASGHESFPKQVEAMLQRDIGAARVEAASLLPGVAGEGVRLALDGGVDPRAAMQATLVACAEAGVLLFRQGVTGLTEPNPGVTLADGSKHHADTVVLAAGIGAQAFAGAVPELANLVPVKGQMVAVRAPGLTEIIVRAGPVYVVPRGDLVVVGATSEPGQGDMAVDPAAVSGLLARAAAVLPGLAGRLPVASWAGVRPGTADHLPLVGWSSRPGVYLAAGWHRNGVLLAPWAAGVVASELIDGGSDPRAAPFRPGRFAAPECGDE